MALLRHAHCWIEDSWREVGSSFNANHVPVVQFEHLDVDDTSYSFKNEGVAAWLLVDGKLVVDRTARVTNVPFVAFSVNESLAMMNVQVQWAGRCGYGYELIFSAGGEVVEQRRRWIS
jgi:hypothetical protein